ncbi:Hypothetical Protein FCC1311_058462 [Hondaea fermentalgiana]|uniref:Uncharacterized protein n=1 Tax=Hondaea fermentalgiana TaxID=2315210 RepID=A0A2R5GGA1_9STRA|nr:Hypothetical Protein FCC1311_058462 [Hondaea fermentalgiana]|eukprot:GBG29625.1 Hypothetical Protein FCC1311_058462 [Hondaea fermentalgiana]
MYGTTAGDSFRVPERKVTPKPQVGMLIRDGLRNFDRMGVYKPQQFGEGRTPIKTFARFDDRTTHNMDFGPRNKASFADKKIAASAARRPAGGHPSQPPSKKDVDAAQDLPPGSWLYHVAPEFKPFADAAPEGDEAFESKSSSDVFQTKAKNHSRQITFGLTNVHSDLKRIDKVSIFQDEI